MSSAQISNKIERGGKASLYSRALLRQCKEMTTFVKKENGKMEAIEGAHDDLVMAKAIAHFISSQQSNLWIEAEVEEDDFIEENFTSESDEGNGFMNWEDF